MADFWTPCWACRVLGGERIGCIVEESRDVVVAMNPFPLAAGHALVMPRTHIENVYSLPPDLAGPVLATASRVARAAKRAFAADGITLRQNNEAASDQHLFHFHLHVVPRFAGDEARFAATPVQVGLDVQQATAMRLRAALAEDTGESGR